MYLSRDGYRREADIVGHHMLYLVPRAHPDTDGRLSTRMTSRSLAYLEDGEDDVSEAFGFVASYSLHEVVDLLPHRRWWKLEGLDLLQTRATEPVRSIHYRGSLLIVQLQKGVQ